MNASLLFFAATFVAGPFSDPTPPTEVEITNLSNNPIWVAEARTKFGRNFTTKGWTQITTNNSFKFSCTGEERLFLRVVGKNSEITFTNYVSNFRKGPTYSEPFTAAPSPNDSKVLVLAHGVKRDSVRNIRMEDALPAGWSTQRFFEVPAKKGVQRLKVMPN
ncbi:MAG TPA: hypothetical protein VNC50_19585 [Planctomycetia bacterium]|nr:hypothetical protein [Planctomycetia bacterium]